MLAGVCLIACLIFAFSLSAINDDNSDPAVSDSAKQKPTPTPEPTPYNNGRTIYLTFDDGPYSCTNRLLDILKEQDVKATFFVTNQNGNEYQKIIAREFEEGHSIGVHTASHNYRTIYKDEQSFYADFAEMEDIIKRQTGEYSKLYRFPGGSSNTVSKVYNDGIISRVADGLEALGYVYFDWNVASGDTENNTTTELVVKATTEKIASCKDDDIIVLQHDIFDYSVEAVEEIIEWGKSEGYLFDRLTVDSPTVHLNIAN